MCAPPPPPPTPLLRLRRSTLGSCCKTKQSCNKLILERSRTALWRLIHATAKSSSSLNTYLIPDFFGPAAMQRETFSRARKILGIRILPRAPTLQTYLFWPIGVNHATAKPSSSLNTYPIPDFFGAAAMQRHTFSRARKKNWILSGCR